MTTQEILQGVHDWTNGKIVYDISVAHPDGQGNPTKYADLTAALGTGGGNIPEGLRKGGMSIKFIHTSDNNYVQYRLMADEFTTNTDKWAIDSEDVLVENSEYVYVQTDKDGGILWAIKIDGGIYYGAGVPKQVVDYINGKISEYHGDDIIDFLDSLEEGDKTLQELLNGKVDKEEGKVLADENLVETVVIEDSKEYASVVVGNQGAIIDGTGHNGEVYHNTMHNFNNGVRICKKQISLIQSQEFVDVNTDKKGKVYEGTRPDGTKYLIKIESPTIDTINESIDKIKNGQGELFPLNYWLPLVKNYTRTGIVSANNPYPQTNRSTLSLLWMSDIHNSKDNAERFLYFGNKYKEYIDDMLLTGDIVGDKWTNDISGITNLNGFDKVLFCVGNHDLTSYNGEFPYVEGNVPKPEAFARYFKQWDGVVYPENASIDGKMYWYKDYDAAKIRLISLCYSGFSSDTVQQAWFADVLEGARVNGYAVLAATHVPRGKKIAFSNCTFEGLDNAKVMAYDSNTVENDIVNTFISNGGEFICWLFGHTHDDHCGYMKDYPKQAYIVIGGALANDSIWQDTYRPVGTKAQDLFNILSVEPTDKLIRVARIGAEYDRQGRHRGTMIISYSNNNPELVYNN